MLMSKAVRVRTREAQVNSLQLPSFPVNCITAMEPRQQHAVSEQGTGI